MGDGVLMMDWGRVDAFLFNPFLEVPWKGLALGYSLRFLPSL